MGRRPDAPAVQEAKGYPGKRKTKVERQRDEALRLASLLASAPAAGDGALAPPAFFGNEACAPALAIWRRYAPELARINLLHALDRDTFALFCVYAAEFYQCAEIAADASRKWSKVKTVSGDLMWREHPAVSRMDEARKAMLEISKRFGLTALDRIELIAKQQGQGAGAFNPAPGELPLGAPEATAARDESNPIGVLGRLDSAPPGRVN